MGINTGSVVPVMLAPAQMTGTTEPVFMPLYAMQPQQLASYVPPDAVVKSSDLALHYMSDPTQTLPDWCWFDRFALQGNVPQSEWRDGLNLATLDDANAVAGAKLDQRFDEGRSHVSDESEL